jgi:hypothetical protein
MLNPKLLYVDLGMHIGLHLIFFGKTGVANSNSLPNQLGIHLILAKQEKLTSDSLTKAKLTSPPPSFRRVKNRNKE